MDEHEKMLPEGETHPAMHAEMSPQKKDRFLPVSILVAAVMICGAIVFSTFYHPGAPAAPAAAGTGNNPAPAAQGGVIASSTTNIMTLGTRDAILGTANAPVTIVEYGDYQCPFCAQFFSQTEPLIVENYVNLGKARMVFRNFPFLGPESTAAAEAAECAEDQNQLWAYHNALYQAKVADEAKGGGENDGIFSRALFVKLAQQINLNVMDFTTCIDSNKYADEVSSEKSTAQALGVNSTPTFFINGQQILGANPYADFQTTIDAALKG